MATCNSARIISSPPHSYAVDCFSWHRFPDFGNFCGLRKTTFQLIVLGMIAAVSGVNLPFAHGASPDREEVAGEDVSLNKSKSNDLIASTSVEMAAVVDPADNRRVRRDRYLRALACGPLSLIAVMKNLGVSLTEAEEDDLVNSAGTTGVSLLELQKIAKDHGLHSVGVQLSPEQLHEIELPAIVHVNDYGFAAKVGKSPAGFQLVYPLEPPVHVTLHDFTSQFGEQGYALIISSSAESLTRFNFSSPRGVTDYTGPKFSPSRSMISAGLIYSPDWNATLKITNPGTKVLELGKPIPSCSCMEASLDNRSLSPGDTAVLKINGQQDSFGPFTYSIAIETNMEQSSLASIPVRGYREEAIWFDKPVYSIDPIACSSKVTAVIPYHVVDDCQDWQVDVEVPENEEFTFKMVNSNSGAGPRALQIVWKGATEPGWYRYPIKIGFTHSNTEPSQFARVQLAVHVEKLIQPIPASIRIRESEINTAWKRKIRLKLSEAAPKEGIDPREIEILWDKDRFYKLITTSIAKPSVRKNELELVLASANGWQAHHDSVKDSSAALTLMWKGKEVVSIRVWISKESF